MGPMNEIDLHGTGLFDAKLKIIESTTRAYNSDWNGLVFIHGYHGGTAIRDYIRSKHFVQDLASEGLNIPMKLDTSKPGSTSIIFP